VDWQAKASGVEHRLSLVARMHSLSPFGLATAATTYAESPVHYHAEFGGLPPQQQLDTLTRARARLVDGRWPRPNAGYAPRLTGVSAIMQAGHPSTGGFGALPLQQHVQSLTARWGLRLARCMAQPAHKRTWWCRIALALLSTEPATTHLRAGPLMLLNECGRGYLQVPSDSWLIFGCPRPRAGTALRRLLDGLRALPPTAVVADLPPLGNWCAGMPLWGNPLLDRLMTLPAGSSSVFGAWGEVMRLTDGRISTVGEAVLWSVWLAGGMASPQQRQALLDKEFGPIGQPPALLAGDAHPWQELQRLLSELVAALPAEWDGACRRTWTAQPQSPEAWRQRAEEIMLTCLGWHQYVPEAAPSAPPPPPPTGPAPPAAAPPLALSLKRVETPKPVTVSDLTVKQATALQLASVTLSRTQRVMAYAQEALEGVTAVEAPDNPLTDATALRDAAWALPLEHKFKAPLWQLMLDGVKHPHNAAMDGRSSALTPASVSLLRAAAGLPPAQPPFAPAAEPTTQPSPAAAGRRYQCSCGQGECSRAHHFSECCVARAVMATIQEALPPTCPPVQRHHLWLGVLPDTGETLRPPAWALVCTAAIAAMEAGRKRLRALQQQRAAERARNGGLRQTRITEHLLRADGQPAAAPPAPITQLASARAVADFWATLQAFVSKGVPKKLGRRWWRAGVFDDHPFVGCDEDGNVRLNRPGAEPLLESDVPESEAAEDSSV
jgi:hypothetical protein